MASVTLYPTASNHDAREVFGGTVTLNDTYFILNAGTQWAGLWVDATAHVASFPGKITAATLRYKPTSTAFDSPNLNWYGNDADTAAVFTTAASSISTRALTTATTSDSAANVGTGFREVDVTAIVEEITDRPGWTGPICLIIDCIAGSDLRLTAFDNGSNFWELGVSYSVANLLQIRAHYSRMRRG